MHIEFVIIGVCVCVCVYTYTDCRLDTRTFQLFNIVGFFPLSLQVAMFSHNNFKTNCEIIELSNCT